MILFDRGATVSTERCMNFPASSKSLYGKQWESGKAAAQCQNCTGLLMLWADSRVIIEELLSKL